MDNTGFTYSNLQLILNIIELVFSINAINVNPLSKLK
jgi:hypothetical protein